MPHTPHVERHFLGSAVIRDIVIGMSDGLTVPFALAAGLSGAIVSSRVITVAGLAEIAAGAIAMGLGGFLAARSDAEHYGNEMKREQREVDEDPDLEAAEIVELFEAYGVSAAQSQGVVAALRSDPESWVRFMMQFELGLERPQPRRALASAVTIALAYIAGGLIPIAPYFASATAAEALPNSITATLAALALFGLVKGRFTGAVPLRSAVQTMAIGSVAAAAAFILARLVQ
jgi:VIT1/CCC1 family predicted Fe2+/Mn2+ transporter